MIKKVERDIKTNKFTFKWFYIPIIWTYLSEISIHIAYFENVLNVMNWISFVINVYYNINLFDKLI